MNAEETPTITKNAAAPIPVIIIAPITPPSSGSCTLDVELLVGPFVGVSVGGIGLDVGFGVGLALGLLVGLELGEPVGV